jgi:hypothetical protein
MTDKKLAVNRKNALKSTGPKIPKGRWTGDNAKLDADAVAKLAAKLCRPQTSRTSAALEG